MCDILSSEAINSHVDLLPNVTSLHFEGRRRLVFVSTLRRRLDKFSTVERARCFGDEVSDLRSGTNWYGLIRES